MTKGPECHIHSGPFGDSDHDSDVATPPWPPVAVNDTHR